MGILYKLICFGKTFIKRYIYSDIAGSSAELSYYLLFFLFQLIMATSAFTFANDYDKNLFLIFVDDMLPEAVSELLEQLSDHVKTNKNAAYISSGVFFSLFSVARYISRLKRKIREIFMCDIHLTRIKEIILSFVFSIFTVAGFGFSLMLDSVSDILGIILPHKESGICCSVFEMWRILKYPLTVLFLFILLFLIYMIFPLKKKNIIQNTAGAFTAAVLWIVASVGFSYYADNISSHSVAYGSLSAFIVLILWLYIINNVILSGAIICNISFTKQKCNAE